jgi:hypothetical protein
MGFFKNLTKKAKDKAAMQDQSVSIERLPTESKGLGSLLGSTRRKTNPNLEAFLNSQMYKDFQDRGGIGTMDMYTASDGTEFGSGTVGKMYEKFLKEQAASKSPPAPTGIEALIRPMRTDPNNQQDMQRLMDMQKQTFRSFLAPPPPQPATSFGPIDGTRLGLPMGPGTPAPAGVVMEPVEPGGPMFEDQLNYAPSTKQIQDILDDLPRGVPVPGIPSIPIPDIPYQIPEITEMPQIPQVPLVPQMPQIPQVPLVPQMPFVPQVPFTPQLPIMPSVGVSPMPAMRLARAELNDFGAIGRGDR